MPVLALFLSIPIASTHAATLVYGRDTNQDTLPVSAFLRSHGYVQADIGLSSTLSANAMLVNNGAVDPHPANVDVYSTQNNTQGGMASLMAGLRWQTDNTFLPAYSLAFRYQNMFNQAIKGTITQYSDPDFTNYNYTWNVQSNVLSLFSKINLFEYKHLLPYIDVGAGCAINNSGNYQETARPGVIARIDSPAFGSNSSNQLSYDIGAGIDYQFNRQMLVSIGYEFQDLGSLHSGNGQAPWSSDRLMLGQYKTNTVLLSLSYMPGA